MSKNIFLFLLAISVNSQHNSFKQLEQSIQDKIVNKEIPSIVLAISKNGKTIYENAFGKSDIANNKPATVNTSYQIASISKTLTATAIDLFSDPEIIAQAKTEFLNKRGKDFKYIPLLSDRQPALNYRD